MKIKDLRTGDIVVLRNATIGFCVEKENDVYILYDNNNYDCSDIFEEDITDKVNNNEYDIMRVYRGTGAFIYYNDYWDGELIFDREPCWNMPSE